MRRALILSLASVCLTATGTTQAQAACLPHAEVVAGLQQYYDESVRGRGLGEMGGFVLELYVSESGSWTILMTHTNGLSCVKAAGQDWMPAAGTTENTEDPA